MKKKGTSANAKAAYKTYKDTNQEGKNAEKRLLRHLLKHPNDSQSESHIVPDYRSKK